MRRRLQQLRLQKGMSYKDVAKAIGVTERAYRYIEAGERTPSLAVADRLEDLFGLGQRELLVQEDSITGKEASA